MTETTTPDTLRVADGDIPLPPAEMWASLAGDADADRQPAAAKAAPKVAELEFVGAETDLPLRRVPLRFPFRFDGTLHTEIVVRRLTVQQMGDFWDRLPADGTYDRIDVYAMMCGLPAAVVRALPDLDGQEVTAVCFDFLPRALAGASA